MASIIMDVHCVHKKRIYIVVIQHSNSQKPSQGIISLLTTSSSPLIIPWPLIKANSLPLILLVFLNGVWWSSSSSLGNRSSSGRESVFEYVNRSTLCVPDSASEEAWESGVDEMDDDDEDDKDGEGWKCARRRAENKSPTPEKYPGISGTICACTVDKALVDDDVCEIGSIVDDIHRRYEFVANSCSDSDIEEKGEVEREGKDEDEDEEQVLLDGSGWIDVGSAVDSHGLSGIDVITTLGTLYCSCKIFNARCREARSSNLVSVKTLYQRDEFFKKIKDSIREGRTTHSTSNQLGVMIVASGNIFL